MNKYLPYTASELHILINELETVRNQPYMLHAAYALQSLTELALAEPEEDEEEPTIESMWGMTIPKKIIDRLVEDVAYDFNDAACNHKPIKIWGKSVSIRKANSYDRSRLSLIFSFQENEGKYTLAQDGIINLNNTSDSQANQYEAAKDEAKENRLYLRRIIKMAEDDANNGWDKLTDMEIVLYCWAMYFNKTQSSNYLDFIYMSMTRIFKAAIMPKLLRPIDHRVSLLFLRKKFKSGTDATIKNRKWRLYHRKKPTITGMMSP